MYSLNNTYIIANKLDINLRFKNLMATTLQIEVVMVFVLGMGPLTAPLYTIPKHPSANSSSTITLPAGISHPSGLSLLGSLVADQIIGSLLERPADIVPGTLPSSYCIHIKE